MIYFPFQKSVGVPVGGTVEGGAGAKGAPVYRYLVSVSSPSLCMLFSSCRRNCVKFSAKGTNGEQKKSSVNKNDLTFKIPKFGTSVGL
jgi:hypothetical protein